MADTSFRTLVGFHIGEWDAYARGQPHGTAQLPHPHAINSHRRWHFHQKPPVNIPYCNFLSPFGSITPSIFLLITDFAFRLNTPISHPRFHLQPIVQFEYLEMNQQETNCQNYLAEMGGSFSPIDGTPWQGSVSNSPTDLGHRHPACNLVEVAPGEFYTVREVEEHGWMLPARDTFTIPQVPQAPVIPAMRMQDSGSTGGPEKRNLKRNAPSSAVEIPSSKRVATSQTSTGFSHSLASTSNGAIPTANLVNITEVEQCPNFWAMPVNELYEWRRSVTILDRTILGYYQQALQDAEDDLDRASSQDVARKAAENLPSGLPSSASSARPRAKRAKRSVKEESPAPSDPTSPPFKFKVTGPSRLDLIYMRHLDMINPFGTKGQKCKTFHECAIWLKTDKVTSQFFGNLSDSPNSRVLQTRYTQLKAWLAAAEGWSRMDSGTEEDDEELRVLIRSVQDQEETGRALRLASQEEREAVKGRSLLAEVVREQCANKAVQDLEDSLGDADEDAKASSFSRKAKRSASSHANGQPDELTAFTGELGRWNEVSLAAQAEQNTRINQLYERELGIAHDRNENERIMAQSLAAHRTAELALQQQRLEFDKSQINSSTSSLETLESKINTSTQKFDVLENQIGSINQALAVMMKHIVGPTQSTPNP